VSRQSIQAYQRYRAESGRPTRPPPSGREAELHAQLRRALGRASRAFARALAIEAELAELEAQRGR
jgi:hypothetical protein